MKLNKIKLGIATLAACTLIFGSSLTAKADTKTNTQKTEITLDYKIDKETAKKSDAEATGKKEGNIWAESKYDGKNTFFNTNVQQGIITLKYKEYKLEPFLELDLKLDTQRYPWNNTAEVTPGIRLKHGIWQLGLKGVKGFYHSNAKMENIGDTGWNLPEKYKDGYLELQPYFSLWHGWKKQAIKSPDAEKYPLTFVGEEWARILYHGPGSEGLNQNNLVAQGAAEAGIIVMKYKDNLVEPFYQIAINADTKGLPWNNIVSNSVGIKLKNSKQGWQVGIKGFIDKYYGNTDMTNVGGEGWDMPQGDRKGNSGIMLFFTLWRGW